MSGSPHGVFAGTWVDVLIQPETCLTDTALRACWACGFATTVAMTTATTTAALNNCFVIGAFSSERCTNSTPQDDHSGQSKDDVLLAAMHVRHRQAGLRLRNVRLPHDGACLLVVGTKLRLAFVALAREQQVLRHENSGTRRASRPRQGKAFEQRMILHRRRRIAVGNLPRDVASIEIDGGDPSPWRFDDRQSLDQWRHTAGADHLDIRLTRFWSRQPVDCGIGAR